MGRPKKTEPAKTEPVKTNPVLEKLNQECRKQVGIIVEQAKLLSVGKIRNVHELEMAARALTAAENEIVKVQASNN